MPQYPTLNDTRPMRPANRQERLTIAASPDAQVVPTYGIAASLYVEAAGTVSVMGEDDTVAVTWTVPAGSYIFVRTKAIMTSGTSVASVIALYN